MGVLEKKPGVQNWIERLPAPMRAAWNRSIIYRAAVHMHRERGMPVGQAIASAINWAKHICATGDVKQWKGPQSVKPSSRAECCGAVALWQSMKAAAKADNALGPDDRRTLELALKRIEGQALDLAGPGPGLVRVKVKVTNRKGTTFWRTMYVRKDQAKAMQKQKGGAKVSAKGAKVTAEQTAVLNELAKLEPGLRPKGWQKLVKTLVDPRHGGRLGPEKRRLLHDVARKMPEGSPLRLAAAKALKADAARPGERRKGKRVRPKRKARKIKPAQKGKALT